MHHYNTWYYCGKIAHCKIIWTSQNQAKSASAFLTSKINVSINIILDNRYNKVRIISRAYMKKCPFTLASMYRIKHTTMITCLNLTKYN